VHVCTDVLQHCDVSIALPPELLELLLPVVPLLLTQRREQPKHYRGTAAAQTLQLF
jgi:hypothetical protein